MRSNSGQVGEVDPDELALLHPDRVLRVVEGAPVDGVEVVLAVAVRVVAVHDHHELARRRPRLLRVDDERAVEALVDVLLERRRVAVVELHPVRARRELVGERARPARRSRRRRPCFPGWIPWKWIVCGCEPPFVKLDAEDVVLGRADDRPRDGAVVRPGASKSTPWATSIVAVDGESGCTRGAGRAGGGRAGGGKRSATACGPPGPGPSAPIIAAWPRVDGRGLRGSRAARHLERRSARRASRGARRRRSARVPRAAAFG